MRIFLLTGWIILACVPNGVAQVTDFATTDFRKADSLALLYRGHSLQDLRVLSEKLTGPLTTEQEKFRAVYKWICNNIDYDYGLYLMNKRRREKLTDSDELRKWNTKIAKVVFETLLSRHKTVCTGYAYLVKELSYHAGLSCAIINGYGRNAQADDRLPRLPNHSWNSIQLNGRWYFCDATWSSGAMNVKTGEYVRKYNDVYFLQEAAEFSKRHLPADE